MTDRTVNRQFRFVGLKGKGAFAEFGTIVPDVAREVLVRSAELGSSTGHEIAVFQPKLSDDHIQGEFIAGLMVDKPVHNVPAGMVYMEIEGEFATASGNIEDLNNLHADLFDWTAGNGYQIDRNELIIEVYIPKDFGEDVEIYLPLLTRETFPNR
ncbi:hypothetical protein AV656_03220 [Bhargavaea cecembensis]|uniref:GyrI-like small molecule binding domain-containing protein n=1 Tax=Bhargavaea cecembensis TaxID=394098 RepID=A0A163GIP6_9BACL|nr:GyrI-like domain-containing protein [Bhargavaea cecembensis]KZE40287.1 hypothetical protein AV656_03220 [Bhargavaea cecembensis]